LRKLKVPAPKSKEKERRKIAESPELQILWNSLSSDNDNGSDKRK